MNHDLEGSSERLRKLLLRANDGEATARQELIDAAAERLRLLAQRMLRRYPRLQRWEETDDVMQEATWKLYRSLEAVQPGSVREFFGLAATQVRRTLIDLVRHHFGPEGDAAHHETDSALGEGVQSFRDPEGGPETLEEWSFFHELVEGLPTEEQEAFSLVWYGGLTQREAAEVLQISERTMIRRMNRARLLLYQALNGQQTDASEP
jgi:RNA polymerase sigma factor (sigma-70 family)